MAHLNSVFPMMIALFDPGHLLINLRQDGHRALPWSYNSVMVQSRRYKVAQVVQLELDAGMRWEQTGGSWQFNGVTSCCRVVM
jgi:hypothetical protein